jgi:hypothetical protein
MTAFISWSCCSVGPVGSWAVAGAAATVSAFAFRNSPSAPQNPPSAPRADCRLPDAGGTALRSDEGGGGARATRATSDAAGTEGGREDNCTPSAPCSLVPLEGEARARWSMPLRQATNKRLEPERTTTGRRQAPSDCTLFAALLVRPCPSVVSVLSCVRVYVSRRAWCGLCCAVLRVCRPPNGTETARKRMDSSQSAPLRLPQSGKASTRTHTHTHTHDTHTTTQETHEAQIQAQREHGGNALAARAFAAWAARPTSAPLRPTGIHSLCSLGACLLCVPPALSALLRSLRPSR